MSDGYFQCLLECPNLRPLHNRPDLLQLTDRQLQALAAGQEVVGEEPQLHGWLLDGRVDDEASGNETEQALALPPPPNALSEGGMGDARLQQPDSDPFTIHVGGATAHFDGHSHSSGQKRGYIHCACSTAHGPRCFEYRQVRAFPNAEHCTAWLVVWGVCNRKDAPRSPSLPMPMGTSGASSRPKCDARTT